MNYRFPIYKIKYSYESVIIISKNETMQPEMSVLLWFLSFEMIFRKTMAGWLCHTCKYHNASIQKSHMHFIPAVISVFLLKHSRQKQPLH